MDSHSLTVLKFIPKDSAGVATRPSPSLPTPIPSLPSQAHLSTADAAQARNLIAASVASDGWRTLNIPEPRVATFDLSRCYVYKKRPPSRNSLTANRASGKDTGAIKDWGSPPAVDELANPDELKEFVSTDLSDVFLASSPSEEALTIDRKGKRKATATLEGHNSPRTRETHSKRAKLDLVLAPKQYHYYPYPLVRKSLDMKIVVERVPTYKKSLPIYLHPNSENDVKKYLGEPFATSAWLIPIRGRLPWPDASAGKVVEEQELKEDEQPVVWTTTGLKKFWEFLVMIYEQQKVGPMSLSLHIARGSSETHSDEIGGVLDQDHIKVRHDASLAMNIRTILDIWKYEASPSEGDNDVNHASQPRKIRPLRGAKLVLVDDCSEGLLVL
ncbi:hypothetical protein SCHPADRAFT_944947 [Schizopora paradoxa]|uniref:Uncharacterized protein n=1 Tax=Schizopora paradoxa TaxID=27342 RepID=A0A0H2R8W2_9AGAM|nr:hypothetical protein SCHPADRAFT_944947 [Schizopora paradoxa]